MDFTYQPNFRDNFHAAIFSFWGTPTRALRSALVCTMFGLFLFVFLRSVGYSAQGAIVAALAGAAGWALVFSIAFSAWLAWSIVKRQRSRGPARISVTAEGVERSSGSASLRVAWEGVARIDETRHAFYLYDESRPVFAIEKSALASREELRALREFLRERKPGRYFRDEAAH